MLAFKFVKRAGQEQSFVGVYRTAVGIILSVSTHFLSQRNGLPQLTFYGSRATVSDMSLQNAVLKPNSTCDSRVLRDFIIPGKYLWLYCGANFAHEAGRKKPWML